jgi:hypothetical protein
MPHFSTQKRRSFARKKSNYGTAHTQKTISLNGQITVLIRMEYFHFSSSSSAAATTTSRNPSPLLSRSNERESRYVHELLGLEAF